MSYIKDKITINSYLHLDFLRVKQLNGNKCGDNFASFLVLLVRLLRLLFFYYHYHSSTMANSLASSTDYSKYCSPARESNGNSWIYHSDFIFNEIYYIFDKIYYALFKSNESILNLLKIWIKILKNLSKNLLINSFTCT